MLRLTVLLSKQCSNKKFKIETSTENQCFLSWSRNKKQNPQFKWDEKGKEKGKEKENH
jgi:hypothetical protein